MSWWVKHRKAVGLLAAAVGSFFVGPELYGAVAAADGAAAAGVGSAAAADAAVASGVAAGGVGEAAGWAGVDAAMAAPAAGVGASLPAWAAPAASLGSGALSALGQANANVANAKQAEAQMAFQASQTGTSWQRGVADMKAAGLNPMLAYSQGGASSGSGAQATMGNTLGAGVSSAQQGLSTMASVGQAMAQTANTRADTDLKLSQPGLQRAQIQNVNADTLSKLTSIPNIAKHGRNLDAATDNIIEGIRGTAANAAVAEQTVGSRVTSAAGQAQFDSAKGGLADLVGKGTDTINTGKSAIADWFSRQMPGGHNYNPNQSQGGASGSW
jgi:hypothetical protein